MAEMRFESRVCEEGPTCQAIYDIYLWTRLRDRNPEEVKVGFVTYFSPDVEIPIDWHAACSSVS